MIYLTWIRYSESGATSTRTFNDPIICFTYKDILYDNGTEIVETYYKFHNLSRVYQEFVDGNYNERIDDNNTLYSDKQATFTGDIIYYTE